MFLQFVRYTGMSFCFPCPTAMILQFIRYTSFCFETGRWNSIPKHERFCNLCNVRDIENEFHYICICQKVEIVQLRSKYIPSYFVRNPSENKLSGLLSFCNIKVLNHLAIFLKKISNCLMKKSNNNKSRHLPMRLYI